MYDKSSPAVFYLHHASPITVNKIRAHSAVQICQCEIKEGKEQDVMLWRDGGDERRY